MLLLEGVVIAPCPADGTHKSADRRKAEEIKISKYINNTRTSHKKNDFQPPKNEGGNFERVTLFLQFMRSA
jgi:hypothetical protein